MFLSNTCLFPRYDLVSATTKLLNLRENFTLENRDRLYQVEIRLATLFLI